MSKGSNAVSRHWKQYKYRFLPWLALNWKKNRKSVRRISRSEDCESGQDGSLSEKLEHLFREFHQSEAANIPRDIALFETCGFCIERRKSSIADAGYGVFVAKGSIAKNAIAAMYPGTIYNPSDPILIQSISNQYILRCIDGIMVDGKSNGISKYIYRSCSKRDMIGAFESCDTSWLTETQKNPLAIGQYVNNQTSSMPANVVYQEVDIPISFPLYIRKYLPNICYRNKFIEEQEIYLEDEVLMRVVILRSLTEINANEELFSAYFTEVF